MRDEETQGRERRRSEGGNLRKEKKPINGNYGMNDLFEKKNGVFRGVFFSLFVFIVNEGLCFLFSHGKKNQFFLSTCGISPKLVLKF